MISVIMTALIIYEAIRWIFISSVKLYRSDSPDDSPHSNRFSLYWVEFISRQKRSIGFGTTGPFLMLLAIVLALGWVITLIPDNTGSLPFLVVIFLGYTIIMTAQAIPFSVK
ncbi:MAG: hypothetical protein EAX95_16290 [Candidatus Thorarchaeota archaeon]|nr:hypothetical protein [Candidatus Thorarchaeota archaeon]